MLLDLEQVGDFRAAPAVNALIVVADHAKVAVLAGQVMDQAELRGVGVLVFIHHHVAVAGAAGFQRHGLLAEEPQREQNQIVKVHRIAGAQGRFVAGAEVLGQGAPAGVGQRRRMLAAIAKPAEPGQNCRGISLRIRGGNLRQDLFEDAKLLRFVIDDEVALVAEFLDVLPQNAHAQGVKGANGGGQRGRGGRGGRGAARRLAPGSSQPFADQLGDPLLHLARRLVGECDAQNVAGGNPALDEMRHAMRNHPRLAGSRAGQDQDRAVNRLHGQSLLRVKRVQMAHRRAV